jgi:chaperone BCS1
VFGVDIYVLSLLDSNLTESQLVRLFSEVPARCIVLLEDVDAAGLKRVPEPKAQSSLNASSGQLSIMNELRPIPKPATAISLSGLLNTVDGVSSQEGRILIMSTNAPDTLDKALVRPGRVDMQVAFELPKRAEMRELFLSLYNESFVEAVGKWIWKLVMSCVG